MFSIIDSVFHCWKILDLKLLAAVSIYLPCFGFRRVVGIGLLN